MHAGFFRKYSPFLLVFFVVLSSLTYYHRLPTGDDAWFAEQSYWLHREGVIRSEFFTGVLNWDKQLFAGHKLFLAFGALMIRWFGHYLPVPQFTGLICFVIIIVELILYTDKNDRRRNFHGLLWLLILLFSNRLMVKMSFQNRPEMMLAALGFGSFLLLRKKGASGFNVVAAGFLAGLAVLGHLNGIIYLIGGCGTLVISRRYKMAVVFALAGGLTGLMYFIDIFQAAHGWEMWCMQFRNDPATQKSFGFSSKLLQLITYPRLFFHSPEQLALSLLLVFMLWQQRKLLSRLPIFLRTYCIVIFISFWLITKSNTALYMVLFIPFMLALIYELYWLAPFQTKALDFVLTIYFVIGIVGMIQIIHQNITLEYLPASYEKLSTRLPKDKAGLVPLTFFFNSYDQFQHLLVDENYEIQSGLKGMTTEKMARWAHSEHADFILMDYVYWPKSHYPPAGTKSIPYFQLTFFDGRFAIYSHLR